MNNCAVLNVHLITHPDAVNIAAYHRVEPETAIIACNHIANDRGIRGDKAVVAKPGRHTFDR
jgi:hypothetical protein